MRINGRFFNQVTLITLIVASLCGWFWSPQGGLPLFLGALWGVANLVLIQWLSYLFFSPVKKSYFLIGGLLVLKCPLLYFLGYFLLKTYHDSILNLLIGLTLLLVILILTGIKENLSPKKAPNE